MARDRALDTNVPNSKQDGPYPKHTDLVGGYGKYLGECYAGTVTGTGAALDVACPFDPAYVEIFNLTTLSKHTKFPSQLTDKSVQEVTAGTISELAAGGITLGTKKFTLGTAANLNAAGNAIYFVAYGFRENGGK